MKVGVVVRRLCSDGGTERFTLGLVRHLVEAGDAVTVWTLEPGERPPGVAMRRLPGPPVRGRVPRMLRVAWGASRVARAGLDHLVGMVRAPGFDVWRAGGGCHADWLAAAQRRITAAERIDLHLDRQAARTARRVVVNSTLGGDGLQARYGVAADRIRLIRNGVDLDRFHPRPHARARSVVFLGNGWRRKGLSTAILAMQALPEATLDIWGSEARPGRWRAQVQQLGMTDRVRFCGPCPDPAATLPGYDAMVLPTRYDPLANVCLEALACGVPVVTSARNGAAELSPDPGWVVADPSDALAFAHALERALQSRQAASVARAAAEAHPAAAAFDRFRSLLVEPSA